MTSLNNFKMDADRNVDEPVSISLQIPDCEIKILIDYLNIRWLVELLILMTCWATCKKTWTSRGLRPNRREFVLLVPSLLLGKWSLHLATLGIQSTSCAVTATRNWEQWTFLREMASHTVSKTTITSSPPGVATARVPFWTSASLHWTRLGILSISSVLIVADRLGEHLLLGGLHIVVFQFGDEGFHEKDDAAFCKDCYFEQFAPKCGGCNTPITENYISSLNLQVGRQMLYAQ